MKKGKFAAILAAAVLLGLASWWLLFGNIAETVTVEVGRSVSTADFVVRGPLLFAELETVPGELTVPGEYPVTVRWLWQRHNCIVRVVDTVPPEGQVQELTAFVTQIPAPDAFVLSAEDATELTISYETPPNAELEGPQQVVILLTDLGGNVTRLETVLTLIHDREPPMIEGAKDHWVYLGTTLDLAEGVTVSDALDPDAALTLDTGTLDWNAAGEYPITYTAVDACGNETTVTASVTIIEDVTPPQILGVTARSFYIGSTVAYRSGVLVVDDTDGFPKLSVDSSQVDLSKPGTYPVIYTATDCVGNTAACETTITVREKPRSAVEEDVILEAADKLLEKLIDEDMTPREQVEAVYDWIDRNCYYISDFDKSDYMQSAYIMLKTQRGDCYGFYALSRLLFDRLGLANLTVTRMENPRRTSSHYWNMVSLDGGESWYHFDSTPHMSSNMRTCLVTDAQLEQFNQSAPYYYHWDREAYPATPEN